MVVDSNYHRNRVYGNLWQSMVPAYLWVELEGPSFEDGLVIFMPPLFGIDERTRRLVEIGTHGWTIGQLRFIDVLTVHCNLATNVWI